MHYCDVPPLVTGHPGRSIFTTEYSRHWRLTSICICGCTRDMGKLYKRNLVIASALTDFFGGTWDK